MPYLPAGTFATRPCPFLLVSSILCGHHKRRPSICQDTSHGPTCKGEMWRHVIGVQPRCLGVSCSNGKRSHATQTFPAPEELIGQAPHTPSHRIAKAQFKIICQIFKPLLEAPYAQFSVESLKENNSQSTASAYLPLRPSHLDSSTLANAERTTATLKYPEQLMSGFSYPRTHGRLVTYVYRQIIIFI
ncbi:Uncharacterized protein HZ326_19966 [Fusarium oxysporum f. sp. albedinis]|nr:Uncharacterized protein HZ326_19966 [Fusarium oxysporum f. sp. albedinis]